MQILLSFILFVDRFHRYCQVAFQDSSLITSSVTMSKAPYLSESQFPYLENEVIVSERGSYKDQMRKSLPGKLLLSLVISVQKSLPGTQADSPVIHPHYTLFTGFMTHFKQN